MARPLDLIDSIQRMYWTQAHSGHDGIRHFFILSAIVLLLFPLSVVSQLSDASIDSVERSFTTSVGDVRKYLTRVPAGFETATCANVVFDFHCAGGAAENEFNYTGFL
jgi:hypothetical protein